MLTECPHCLSVLKVSAELIYAGDPRVRCGECLRVFSARDHLTPAEADLDTTKIYQPPKRETVTTEEPLFSLKPEVAEGLQALVDKPRKPKTVSPRNTLSERPPVERTRRAAIPSKPAGEKSAQTIVKDSTPAAPKPSTPTAAPAAMGEYKTESPKDRHISVLAQTANAGRSAPARRWSVATFLLLGALTLLAIDAIRSVMNDPDLQAKLEDTWCGLVSCDAEASRDFSQLQIVRRKIYAHPNAQGVLVISLAMVNRLGENMVYPTLQVRMTAQDGEVIASGEFEPSHYAPGFQPGMTIEPERVLDVVLQVEDPGEAAQSFDLEFK